MYLLQRHSTEDCQIIVFTLGGHLVLYAAVHEKRALATPKSFLESHTLFSQIDAKHVRELLGIFRNSGTMVVFNFHYK